MHERGVTEDTQPAWDPNSEVPQPIATESGNTNAATAVSEAPLDQDTRPEVPSFIKEFSREESQEVRDKLAGEIRELRRQRDAIRVEQGELSGEGEKLKQELEELASTLEGYNDASFLGKIKDYFEYKKTKAEIAEKTAELTGVEATISDKEEEIPEFAETRKMIDDFYGGEKKKWAEAGYTPEDIAEQFTEEKLSALSVEEYAELMKRFPGEMVTHVTRQGIRDHAPMREHSAGLGEFHNNFTSMLVDGRMRSAIGIALQEHTKEDAMVKFLKLDRLDELLPGDTVTSPREKALMMHESNFEYSSSSSFAAYADKSSVHMAAELVLDDIYGGEHGNEIFFAYPSAHVASQFRYSGDLTDEGGDKHNDKWIYTKDHEGMSLDAGLTFIPEDAMVDPKTGSRYEVDAEGSPTPSKGARELLDARFQKKGFIQTFIQQLPWKMKEAGPQAENLAQEAFREFGITDPTIQKMLVDEKVLEEFAKLWGAEDEEDMVKKITSKYMMRHTGAAYSLAGGAVSSREYWEKYFQEHPGEKPSKIVFYKGGDPSTALNEWRRKNGIIKRAKDSTYGFSENRVDSRDVRLYKDKDRFSSLAMKVIDDRFPEQAVASAEMEEELAA